MSQNTNIKCTFEDEIVPNLYLILKLLDKNVLKMNLCNRKIGTMFISPFLQWYDLYNIS